MLAKEHHRGQLTPLGDGAGVGLVSSVILCIFSVSVYKKCLQASVCSSGLAFRRLPSDLGPQKALVEFRDVFWVIA